MPDSETPHFNCNGGDVSLRTMTHYLLVKIRELVQREAGQDLVEYALVIALIALGASAGMKQVATAVTTTFSSVSSVLVSAT